MLFHEMLHDIFLISLFLIGILLGIGLGLTLELGLWLGLRLRVRDPSLKTGYGF